MLGGRPQKRLCLISTNWHRSTSQARHSQLPFVHAYKSRPQQQYTPSKLSTASAARHLQHHTQMRLHALLCCSCCIQNCCAARAAASNKSWSAWLLVPACRSSGFGVNLHGCKVDDNSTRLQVSDDLHHHARHEQQDGTQRTAATIVSAAQQDHFCLVSAACL